MAVLVAAGRTDVASIVTVAGNLDHALWTRMHEVSPLRYSLNPIDVADQLQDVPQLHLVGQDDDVVPPEIIRSYINAAPHSVAQMRVVPRMGHESDWERIWSGVVQEFWSHLSDD